MVIVLTLVVMAFGAITIPPFLHYTASAEKAAHVSIDDIKRQQAADAAVELGLWRLNYNVDGVLSNLSLANPTYTYTTTVNGIEVNYSVSVCDAGEGGEPGPMPPTQTGLHMEAILEVSPGWAPAGEPVDFTYTVHARNYGESAIHLKGIYQILPPDFEYIPGSYDGPPNPVFAEEWIDDHWELTWSFNTPRPKVDSEESYPISFGVRGYLTTGAYHDFGEGYTYYSAFGEEEELSVGTLGLASAVGLYDISASAGGHEIQSNAGLYQDGISSNSYQVD